MKWISWRDCYVDMFDELRPTDGWMCERVVCDSTTDSMRIRLRVSVKGKRGKNGKLRANRWAAHIGIGPHRQLLHFRHQLVVFGNLFFNSIVSAEVAKEIAFINKLPVGVCKSVADARNQADELNLDEAIAAINAQCYDTKKIECIWHEPSPCAWEPFATAFTSLPCSHLALTALPVGNYIVTSERVDKHARRTVVGTNVTRGEYGYSSGPTTAGREGLYQALGVWGPHRQAAPLFDLGGSDGQEHKAR